MGQDNVFRKKIVRNDEQYQNVGYNFEKIRGLEKNG